MSAKSCLAALQLEPCETATLIAIAKGAARRMAEQRAKEEVAAAAQELSLALARKRDALVAELQKGAPSGRLCASATQEFRNHTGWKHSPSLKAEAEDALRRAFPSLLPSVKVEYNFQCYIWELTIAVCASLD